MLGWLVAIALIIAGAMFISRGTAGTAILGVIVLIIGFWALFFPAVGGLALVVLLAIGLVLLGLVLIVAGLLGRSTF